MEYTAENLEKAVSVFYRTEAVQQAEAHQWLSEAQNSPQAWSFVWDLLHPQRSSEVQFFAATTLHTKLLKYWNEVPVDHYDMLKKHILEAIVNFAMGPKIVLNRLCITLSAYIIHTVPSHWPKAFEELVSSFQPQYLPNVEPERVIWILLEILTVIPEEFQSTTLATSQRNRVRAVLQDVSKDILKVVDMCLVPIPNASFDMANLTTYLHASKCASTWIQLGGVNIDECSRIINLLVDLTCFVYWNRCDPEGLFSEEMELTEVTLEAISSIIQHPQTHKYRTYVIKHTSSMLESFSKILEVERVNSDQNKDIVNNIYTLLITTADTHCKLFLSHLTTETPSSPQQSTTPQVTHTLFQTILGCTNAPGAYPIDETCSTLTFGFWYTLQDDVMSMDGSQQNGGNAMMLLLEIKPYYRQLVKILLNKARFPLEEDESKGEWTLDDKEMFRCYRQDIADTYMYCYSVLNLEMLDTLHGHLTDALATNHPSSWPIIESSLHAFTAVAEGIELENLYLPKLMQTLKEVPYAQLSNKRVLCASLETVGAYSEWMSDHPDMLGYVVPLVVGSLADEQVAPSATIALKELCHNCGKYLGGAWADVILTACQGALQDGRLKLAECVRIMSTVGRVLSLLPIDHCMQFLNIVLPPTFEELQTLINQEQDSSTATRISTKLKMLSSLFGSLHMAPPQQTEPSKDSNNEHSSIQPVQQQPLLMIVQNTMPLYCMIGKQYCKNAEVMDILWGLMKHVITTLLDDSKPLLTEMLDLMVSVYRTQPQSCVLHVARTVLILFGNDRDCAPLLQQLLVELVNVTLQLCVQCQQQQPVGSNTVLLSEHSDVLEGFFVMLAQVYKKVPRLTMAASSTGNMVVEGCGAAMTYDAGALFECAVVCLSMPELQCLKYCTAFLINFIAHSRESSQAAVVQNFGESLVMRVLLCLGGSAPKTSIDVLSDILLVLNKKYCDNLARWLNSLLQQDDFPTNRVSAAQKQHFIKMVLREKANKRKLAESVTDFMLQCRGLYKIDANAP